MTKTMQLMTKHTHQHNECIPLCTPTYWIVVVERHKEIYRMEIIPGAGAGKRSCQSGCSLHRLHLNASSFISAISNSSRYLLHVVGPLLLISQNFALDTFFVLEKRNWRRFVSQTSYPLKAQCFYFLFFASFLTNNHSLTCV